MENAINSIIEIVETLVQKHRDLLEIETRKQEVLIAGDVVRLKSVVEEEIAVVRYITDLEQTRLEKGEVIADSLDISVEDLTAAHLRQVSSVQQRDDIATLSNEFRDLAEQLKSINTQNNELIEQSLRYVNHMIGVITADPQENKFYAAGPERKPSKSARATFFDAKI